jgi:hypothetical protein
LWLVGRMFSTQSVAVRWKAVKATAEARQTQIPFGDDNQKGYGKGDGRSKNYGNGKGYGRGEQG